MAFIELFKYLETNDSLTLRGVCLRLKFMAVVLVLILTLPFNFNSTSKNSSSLDKYQAEEKID